jgi:hypothetical protein
MFRTGATGRESEFAFGTEAKVWGCGQSRGRRGTRAHQTKGSKGRTLVLSSRVRGDRCSPEELAIRLIPR